MKTIIKITAVLLATIGTASHSSQIMVGSAIDGEVINKTELLPLPNVSCDLAVDLVEQNLASTPVGWVRFKFHSRDGRFMRYNAKKNGIDYMVICLED
tara:strand:+ start:434 stop:727 length:294 start_codon:yes stop_codon:yes gene_type:complete